MFGNIVLIQCRASFKHLSPTRCRFKVRASVNDCKVQSINHYCYDTERSSKERSVVHQKTDTFKEFYRLSYIRMGALLHRMKRYQMLVSTVMLPSTVVLYYSGLIDSSWAVAIAIPGVVLPLNFYGSAAAFTNSIGFMYLSEDETIVKIAYVNSKGGRVDEEMPVEDVVPLLDAPRPLTDSLFKQVVFYSSNTKKFKLFLRFGQVTDKDKFYKVFGPIELLDK